MARRIANDLKAAGVRVWFDVWEIQVGDSIAQKIQHGLDNVDFVAVLLTKHSTNSGWVEKEWQSKVGQEASQKKVCILPLKFGDCTIPSLLVDKKYADFSDYKGGLCELYAALKVNGPSFEPSPSPSKDFPWLTAFGAVAVLIASLILLGVFTPRSPGRPVIREAARNDLDVGNVNSELVNGGLYDAARNPSTPSYTPDYQLHSTGKYVVDNASKLIWQRGGSQKTRTFTEAKQYVTQLNKEHFGGISTWRLPTLPEAMSLVTARANSSGLFAGELFDSTQRYIWTADSDKEGLVWIVGFDLAECDLVPSDSEYFARAVSSLAD